MRYAFLAGPFLLSPFAAQAADLTLHRVLLSAAGVGYFEYTTQTDGAADLTLDIPLSEVDDVLNSLVIFDNTGNVGSIELPGRDATRQAFADVPFAQAMLATPTELLNSLRGEEVAVAGPDEMTGRLVSAVQEPLAAPADRSDTRASATQTRVTLLTEDGFRQFILEDAESVRPTDPTLRGHIAAALDAARQQTAASARRLTLRTTGEGPHTVGVGYVVAAPLWKSSYRLVLPAADTDKARVQGWAVLENQSGIDWKAVDLTLHSGNPVTFHQAIYASYYADRPDLPVNIPGRIVPDADQRATETVAVRQQRPLLREKSAPQDYGPPPAVPLQMPPPAVPMPLPQTDAAPLAAGAMASPANPTETTETPLDTIFHIATPIDLLQGHTASVAILDETMPAEQLDWLQPFSSRLVTAIRLKNTTQTSLPPGALTLYTTTPHGAAFAGDARLNGLPAGETRLLAFAEDLRTTATRTVSRAPETTLHLTVANGILRRTRRERVITTVTLTAPPNDPRRVLIEFPKSPDATFTLADGDTQVHDGTAAAWRVTVSLKPGETRRITAYTDTPQSSEIALLNGGDLSDYVLAMITTDPALPAEDSEKLKPLVALRDAANARQAALDHLTAEQSNTTADEDRVRNNLGVVPGPGALHDKLLAALDADETKLSALRGTMAKAQADIDDARAALADAVEKFDL